MSSIQPSSGAPMPPGAAVGPITSDPAVQAQIAEVQAQLQQVNAQLGAGRPTGYGPADEPTYIGMQGTALVESLERNRAMGGVSGPSSGVGVGDVSGGGGTSAGPRLGDLIDQARIRRDIDEQMGQLDGGVTGGGGARARNASGEHLGGTQPGDSDRFADQMLQQAAAAAGVPASELDELRELAGTDPAGPSGVVPTGEHLGGTRPGDSDRFADQMLQQAAAAAGVPASELDELRELAGTDPAGPDGSGGGGAIYPGERIDENYGRMLDATLPGDVETGGNVGGAIGGTSLAGASARGSLPST